MGVVVSQRAGVYEATSPELPGCRGRGATPEQATRGLERAAERMFERWQRAGLLVPWAATSAEAGGDDRDGLA